MISTASDVVTVLTPYVGAFIVFPSVLIAVYLVERVLLWFRRGVTGDEL